MGSMVAELTVSELQVMAKASRTTHGSSQLLEASLRTAGPSLHGVCIVLGLKYREDMNFALWILNQVIDGTNYQAGGLRTCT